MSLGQRPPSHSARQVATASDEAAPAPAARPPHGTTVPSPLRSADTPVADGASATRSSLGQC